jgi:tripartite-type tricarboxylate transporter receptor subunit TctC
MTLVSAVALAAEFPERRIRHIVPWGAGGATDAAMRGYMRYMEEALGVPVVTENVPGGLSAVGLLRLKTARPDGYTIGTLTYDVLTLELQGLAPIAWRDFDLVGMVTEHPSALIVQSARFGSLAAFHERASRGPNLKVGNVGIGGIWHQHAAAMERTLDVELTHVPYEAGSGAQLAALLGGEVDANVASLPASLPYVRDGTLRVLAVMADERDVFVPDVPTFRELGFDVQFSGFRVVAVPKGTPQAVRDTLERAMQTAFDNAEFQSWADKTALGAKWLGSKETEAYLAEMADRVGSLMRALGMATRQR